MTEGVEGAHLCIPFQCGVCWLRNMEGWDLNGNNKCYLACIKHANLDAMAGKLPLTIGVHLCKTVMVTNDAALVNKTPWYPPWGPFPLADIVGMGLAVDMLVKSLVSKGCIERHVQFSTLRRLRATHTKNWEFSPLGVAKGASFAKGLGRICLTSCPSQPEWFYNFMQGMEYQMGTQSQPNHGLLIVGIDHLLMILA